MAQKYLTIITDDDICSDVYETETCAACEMLAELDAKSLFKEQQRYRPSLRKVINWHAETIAL
jgi:hypothetical protein